MDEKKRKGRAKQGGMVELREGAWACERGEGHNGKGRKGSRKGRMNGVFYASDS